MQIHIQCYIVTNTRLKHGINFKNIFLRRILFGKECVTVWWMCRSRLMCAIKQAYMVLHCSKVSIVNETCNSFFLLGCSCHESCYENMDCCFPDDDDNRSGVENKFSSMECLYVQTGRPAKSWTNTVPAYRIVSTAPRGGCIPYTL